MDEYIYFDRQNRPCIDVDSLIDDLKDELFMQYEYDGVECGNYIIYSE